LQPFHWFIAQWTLRNPRRLSPRVVTVSVAGAPLEPDRRYTAAVADYIVRGGDGFTAFRYARALVDASSGALLADILLDAVAVQPQGRRPYRPPLEAAHAVSG
jgi:2',3'-cyclic-nucleotide 2'-phosphodiesterase (5'-nucleotidase family)